MVTESLPQNPFALLRISAQAPRKEVVERAKELTEKLPNPEAAIVYRKAVEAIISHPLERLVHALWEMPNTDYQEHDDAWLDFTKAFRQNPAVEPLGKQADEFASKHVTPDRLLELLAPLLLVTRATTAKPLTLDEPGTQGLVEPTALRELF